MPRPRALHLARIQRQDRAGADEGGGDVGAARDRGQQEVAADVGVDPLVGFLRQGRTGRADRAQALQVGHLVRHDAGLHAVGVVGGAGAEKGDAGALGEFPQCTEIGRAGIAVVDADGGADQQPRHLRIPHDPAGGRIPVEAVLRPEIELQRMAFQGFQQGAAVAVHDRLRHAGGAGRIQDPQRMVERQLFEADSLRRPSRPQQAVPQHRIRQRGLRIQVGQQHRMLQRRQFGAHRLQHRQPVEVLAAVAVAVDRDQQFRIDLAEAVEHAGAAHVGRAAGPDRADRGAGEKRHRRFRDIRQVGGDAVARLDAERAQAVRHRRDLLPQFAPRQLRQRPQFRLRDDRRLLGFAIVGVKAEYLLGEIQARAVEPFGARHLVRIQHLPVRRRTAHFEVLPDRFPEILEMIDRPLPQRMVIIERQRFFAFQPAHVVVHATTLNAQRRRCP